MHELTLSTETKSRLGKVPKHDVHSVYAAIHVEGRKAHSGFYWIKDFDFVEDADLFIASVLKTLETEAKVWGTKKWLRLKRVHWSSQTQAEKHRGLLEE